MDQDVWNQSEGHLAQGVKMIAAALVSAVVTATVVIAIGQSMVQREAPVGQPHSEARLIQTVG